MNTVYDWITVAIFAGLVVLFLERSMAKEEQPREHDSLLLYLGAGVGCFAANQVGNKGIERASLALQALAVFLIAATIVFILYYLRPFKFWPRA